MPRKRPVFEPEEAAALDDCADSPRSCPPKIATSGRGEVSCTSELVLSSTGSETTVSVSANEFGSVVEVCAGTDVSDSRARGASQAGILISSTSIEDLPDGGGGATLFTG